MTSSSSELNTPRVSRADAIARFVDAVINLMDTKPISYITVQEVATVAGLNHGYVFRYFGTRLDLFTAVTDELADRTFALLSTEMSARHHSNETRPVGDLSLIALGRVLSVKRMALIQYLQTCGVPLTRFGAKSRETIELISVQALKNHGLSSKMAHAQAFKISIMLWAQSALSESFGLTSEEVTELFFLTVDEVTNAKEQEHRLQWS